MWGIRQADDGWMGTTKRLFIRYGMYSHWANPNECVKQHRGQWKEAVYEAVEGAEDIDLGNRFSRMKGEGAATYARIKRWDEMPAGLAAFSGETGRRGALVHERYLDERGEPVGTRLKLMARLGCLPTRVRVAREQRLPPEFGRCELCSRGELEDVTHLLLKCAAHDKYRTKMLGAVNRALSAAFEGDSSDLSDANRADLLLGKSTGDLDTDTTIDRVVTRFLKKAWRVRKGLTSKLNDIFGREDTIWALATHGDGEPKPVGPTQFRARSRRSKRGAQEVATST